MKHRILYIEEAEATYDRWDVEDGQVASVGLPYTNEASSHWMHCETCGRDIEEGEAHGDLPYGWRL